MPFIPHTPEEVREMLAEIGVQDIDALFDEIPAELRLDAPPATLPPGLGEAQVAQLMKARAQQDPGLHCFAGGGAYEHHIPAAVWAIATRGEFYSAYTPYQAEASQGSLQLIYEYQTMMAGLMAMDVSNASLYDGATATAEALLMALRANRKVKARRVALPASLHPAYRETVHTLLAPQGIEVVELPFDASGALDPRSLSAHGELAAIAIGQPNYFGRLEDVHALTDAAHAQGALVVAVVNPLAMAVLAPPGEWGEAGADIACGEGQPLGIPLSFGGPYFGFLCCREKLVRQMPGRLVGRTVDLDGRVGYTLTLQAREQHIRRSKATSNICTNQGLMVTAATVHMAILGPEGLERTALASHANTMALRARLARLPGVVPLFDGPHFHELAVRLPRPAAEVIAAMAERGFLAGVDLGRDYPELGEALLVCATETKTEDDLDAYVQALSEVLS